jgi:hypothetical protein
VAKQDTEALRTLRDAVVAARRLAAGNGDVEAVVSAQQQLEVLDRALADELRLRSEEDARRDPNRPSDDGRPLPPVDERY